LRSSSHPEFDAWRWSPFWVPLDAVIEFKRDVYTMALNELSVVLFRRNHETRYLRQHVGSHRRQGEEQAPLSPVAVLVQEPRGIPEET
jgi:putative (di)nucleoside polyphosphate hydrolase